MQPTSRRSIRQAALLSILTGSVFLTVQSSVTERAMLVPPMFDMDTDTDGIADLYDPLIMPPSSLIEEPEVTMPSTLDTMPASCTNMIDDDSDGMVDYMDMDGGVECDMVASLMDDSTEVDTMPVSCTNMIDDDSDGMVDYMDMDGGVECDMVASLIDDSTEVDTMPASCTNMIDDDSDGMVDYMDIDSGTECDMVGVIP